MTVHYALLLPTQHESGFDESVDSYEGMLQVEGTTAREVHEAALRLLNDRFRQEPEALVLAHYHEATPIHA